MPAISRGMGKVGATAAIEDPDRPFNCATSSEDQRQFRGQLT